MAILEDKEDLIRCICRRLVCRLDRGSVSQVCIAWKDAIERDKSILRSLPLLYVPRSVAPSFSCIPCGGTCHNLLLPDHVSESRFIGSHDGGWVIVARNHDAQHFLCDTKDLNGNWIAVPDVMGFSQAGATDRVILHTVTISGTPSAKMPIQHCIGAAIVTRKVAGMERAVPDIMFWQFDAVSGWGTQDFLLDVVKDSAADSTFHNTEFHFLTIHEQVFVAMPHFNPQDWVLDVSILPCCVYQEDNAPDPLIRARYLVSSRGQLLMVRRYRLLVNTTVAFKVFRLVLISRGSEPEYDAWQWDELKSLDGSMIFVAPGCSRCFEMSSYTEFPNAKEGIYFKGDVEPLSEKWISMDSLSRQELISDCGRWVGPFPGEVSRPFGLPEQMEEFLNHSPPAWILPDGEL